MDAFNITAALSLLTSIPGRITAPDKPSARAATASSPNVECPMLSDRSVLLLRSADAKQRASSTDKT